MYTFGENLKSLQHGRVKYIRQVMYNHHLVINLDTDTLHVCEDFDLTKDTIMVFA